MADYNFENIIKSISAKYSYEKVSELSKAEFESMLSEIISKSVEKSFGDFVNDFERASRQAGL